MRQTLPLNVLHIHSSRRSYLPHCHRAYVCAQLFQGIRAGEAGTPALWARAGQALTYAQTAALAEVVHAAVRLVRASPVTTFIQVASRLLVLWGVMILSPEAQSSYAFALCASSWALVEVPRYTYLAVNTLGIQIPPLTWLRYSLFAVLYPTGISGELWTIFAGLPDLYANKVGMIQLPNTMNLALSWPTVLACTVLLYLPGSPHMYGHMLKRRKHALGGGSAPEKKPKRA